MSPATVTGRIEVRLSDFPDVLWKLTHGLAELLRERAADESEPIAGVLREVAAEFEAGARSAACAEPSDQAPGQGIAQAPDLDQGEGL